MRKAALIFLVLLPELAFSQAASTNSQNFVTKVVRVRYARANAVADLVRGGTPVMVNADSALQVIVLKGQPDAVTSVEQTIRELDVPSAVSTSKDIEVIVSVIGASTGSDLPAGQEMPEGMVPVVKQLRAIFPYRNYQPLSSMLLRSKEGTRSQNSGAMKSLAGATESNYFVTYDGTKVSSEAGKPVIHVRNFRFHTTLETSSGSPSATRIRSSDIDIATDIDLRGGQKTVVGKADTGSNDSALFVVLTARLVD
jgi:type II secretory pathway component GspD/PulD (secretin)